MGRVAATTLVSRPVDAGLGAAVRRPSGEPPPLPTHLSRGTIAWLAGLIVVALVWVLVFVAARPGAWITERDLEVMAPVVEHRADWLTPLMSRLNSFTLHWFTAITGWALVVIGLATRRVRHVALAVAALCTTAAVATVVGVLVRRPRPLGIEIIGEWEGFAQPSRPLSLIAAVATATAFTVTPRGQARRALVAVASLLIALCGFAQVYVGVEHPTDVAAGITLGVTIALLMYRIGAPESVFPIGHRTGNTAHLDVTGIRGRAIVVALRQQLGLQVEHVEPVGLAGSAGSTPLRIDLADGTSVFGKIYARSHLRSDRFYKLGRTLRYGRLEDEYRFASVRRLVQHEDHLLRLFVAAGIPTPSPIGIVELTPEREYLLVTEFLDGASEINETLPVADVDVIDQGLEIVAQLWRAGLAHRDIKPANLMMRGRRLYVVDVAFAEIRPSPWRQAVDLANMMLVLALVTDVDLVVARAKRVFTDDEIAEAFAASRGVTIPSQLRRAIADDPRDVEGRFRELVPARPPVAIQRWSVRRVLLTAWVALATLLVTFAALDNLTEIGLAP